MCYIFNRIKKMVEDDSPLSTSSFEARRSGRQDSPDDKEGAQESPHIDMNAANNPEARGGASSWQEVTLKNFHWTSYFFNRELMPQDLPELDMSHSLSNAMSSPMDPKTCEEYISVSIDKLPPENGQPQRPLVFRAQLGRAVLKCTELARNALLHLDYKYGISKLVLTDRDSQNAFTLGVLTRRVLRDCAIDTSGELNGAINTADADLVYAIRLLYVKYELCPQLQQVVGSPMFCALLFNVLYGQQQQQSQQQQGASLIMNSVAEAVAAQMPGGVQLVSTNVQRQPGRHGQPGELPEHTVDQWGMEPRPRLQLKSIVAMSYMKTGKSICFPVQKQAVLCVMNSAVVPLCFVQLLHLMSFRVTVMTCSAIRLC